MKKTAAIYLACIYAALLAFVFLPHTGAARDVKPQSRELRHHLNIRSETALKTFIDEKALDKKINNEISVLRQKLRELLSRSFWEQGLEVLLGVGKLILFTLLLFGLSLLLLFRFKRYCHGLQSHPFLIQHPHRMTAFRLFSRSLPLLGSTGFIYLYNRTDLPYAAAPIIQVLFHILLILLMSGWWLDFLALKSREKKQYEDLGQRLRFVIIFVRCFAAVYLVLDWLIGKNSIILFWGRLPEREIKSAPFDGWSYGSAG